MSVSPVDHEPKANNKLIKSGDTLTDFVTLLGDGERLVICHILPHTISISNCNLLSYIVYVAVTISTLMGEADNPSEW